MKKLKVMTIVGTRPEIIRLSRVLAALDNSSAIEHISVHTGQNYDYELNEVFYQDLGLRKPDFYLNSASATSNATIGQIFINVDLILERVKPDALLILGDTNSCLSVICAKKLHIPIFHMEAGNRCFDQRVPEETNRKIVDHVADINLTYSDIAREYLIREGLSPDRIIKIGSPMFEVLNHYFLKIQSSDVLHRLGLNKNKYFVVSAHREENISNDRNFFNLLESLDQIANRYGYPIIVSTHPRTRKRLEELRSNSKNIESLSSINPLIKWQEPIGFCDYNALQINSFAVLSDSGTISEESSILNFRALNIREAHERPEAMEEASVMMAGLEPQRILQCLAQLEKQDLGQRLLSTIIEQRVDMGEFNENYSHQDLALKFRRVFDYSMPNVSEKVVRIILSYTNYVNRVVWGKY